MNFALIKPLTDRFYDTARKLTSSARGARVEGGGEVALRIRIEVDNKGTTGFHRLL